VHYTTLELPAGRLRSLFAIMSIGMAKFQNAYYPGFMPKVGCPGGHGDTMEYVEQDQ
jgi:hypothetical protein